MNVPAKRSHATLEHAYINRSGAMGKRIASMALMKRIAILHHQRVGFIRDRLQHLEFIHHNRC